MAAPKENSLFPPNPYYIPGYDGFVPQYRYQFGESFGKTTYRLLTDPNVRKSPYPLLEPLHKQKFIEDFSRTKRGVQGYVSARPGCFPYDRAGAATSFSEPVLAPKPPLLGPRLAEDELVATHMDPVPEHHPGQYVPRTRVPQEYPRGLSGHPASEGQEWRLPEIRLGCGPNQLGSAIAGSKPPIKIESVPETADVEQDNWLPKLDEPNVIQRKAISGYAGFIPHFAWINNVGYTQAVREAMDDFDRQQFLLRNPHCSFGKRFPQTYWPNNRIYTSAGQLPFYTGFVPHNRYNFALTFGNSTRQAYQKEQKRRAFAL